MDHRPKSQGKTIILLEENRSKVFDLAVEDFFIYITPYIAAFIYNNTSNERKTGFRFHQN